MCKRRTFGFNNMADNIEAEKWTTEIQNLPSNIYSIQYNTNPISYR